MKLAKLFYSKKRVYLFFVLISLLYVLTFFDFSAMQLRFFAGDDHPFHLNRVISMMRDLKHSGHVEYLSPFGAAGILYGVNLFYPFLTTILPLALISLAMDSMVNGFFMYLFLLNILTSVIAYHASRYFFTLSLTGSGRKKKAANLSVLFAVLYTFATYRLVCFAVRFSIGEAVAITFLPLVFAGLYSILFRNGEKSVWLIAGMTLIAFSHVLSLLLASLVIGLILLFNIRRLTARRLLQMAYCTISALLASSAVLVPIAEQMLSRHVASVEIVDLAGKAKSLAEMVKEGSTSDLNSYSIGLLVILALFLGAVGFVVFTRNFVPNRLLLRTWLWTSGLFLLSSKIFPWHLLQDSVFKNIQFPFRLFSYITLFALLFLCAFFASMKKVNYPAMILLAVLFSAGVNFVSTHTAGSVRHAEGSMKGVYIHHDDDSLKAAFPLQVYNNTDYLLKQKGGHVSDKWLSLQAKQVIIDGVKDAGSYEADGGKAVIDVAVSQPASKVDLPVPAYKGVIVSENGAEVPHRVSDRGTVEIASDAGKHEYSVSFKATVWMKASWVLTGAGVVLIAFCRSVILIRTKSDKSVKPL